jgi:hypothetical protein
MLRTQPIGATPSELEQRQLTQHFQLESLAGLWLTVALSVMVFGVLVHINLNFVIGVSLIIAGIVIAATTLVGESMWLMLPRRFASVSDFVEQRRSFQVARFVQLAVVLALSVWTAVVMLQRSIKS